MTKDQYEQLASWKAEKLRGPIPSGLLGKLERSHDAKVERIRGSRTLTEESKRLEINEARREFRQDRTKMREEIREQKHAEIEAARGSPARTRSGPQRGGRRASREDT